MSEKWTELFDAIDDIILFIDPDLRIKKINQKGLDFLDKDQTSVIGGKCYESEPCRFCPFLLNQKTGKTETTEQYFNLKGGKWFSIKSTPVFDKQGNPEGFIDILRDISHLKHTEEKLREFNEEYLAANEELNEWNEEVIQLNVKLKQLNHAYELVSAYSSDLVTCYDQQLNLTFISESVLNFSGYMPEEYKFLNIKDLVHPSDFRPFLRFLASLKYSADKVRFFEYRLNHKTRGYFWVEMVANLNANNEEPLWVVNHRNINERKKSEKELKTNEIRLANILKHMTSGVAVYKAVNDGEDFEFTNFNDAAEKITNTSKKNVIGQKLLDVFPNMNKSPLIHALREVYKTGTPRYLEPFFYKDNTRKGWRENQIYKLPTGEVVALFTDVTQIKESQEKLKEQNEEYLAINEELTQTNEELYAAKKRAEENEMEFRELFENMSQGFALHEIILDHQKKPVDYRYIHINRAFEKINQIKASDFIGKRVKEVLPKTEDHWIENFGKVAQTGWPMHFENYSVEFDKYYDVIAYSPRKGFFAVIFTDVTKSKKHEKELTAAKQKAEESDRLKSAFLANMSHEIRTPMNAILGFTDLLNSPRTTPEKREKYSAVIKETGKQLLHIINDVLDISKIESGNITIEKASFRLKSAIQEVLQIYEPLIAQKGLQLVSSFNLPSEDLHILSDKKRLQQILHNLISNAIKFTDKGKIELTCSIDQQYLTIQVKDTGRGIHAENLSKVFDRFWQEKTELEENKGGTGLGLPISYHLAKIMEGSITVDSVKEKGSTFTFSLPCSPLKISGSPSAQPPRKNHSKTIADLQILIAEDEEFNFIYLKELLSIKNYSIMRAVNGKEAVLKAQQEPIPDLIIMDIKMPVMDGVKALRKIKEYGIETPVIALTAYAMKEDQKKYLDLGFDAYISKPIDVDLLFRTIDKFR
ncbi:PAS domain-containing hybrid sensor histidine kinase/response regulator [Marinilabilia sp.]